MSSQPGDDEIFAPIPPENPEGQDDPQDKDES